MQHTSSLNIGGRIINIHDTAWQMKRVYIETLYAYYKNEESGFEIVNDIESRIGELMYEIINRQKVPINEINIKNIIRTIGTVDEFREQDANTDQ
jgi:hypothetical protein